MQLRNWRFNFISFYIHLHFKSRRVCGQHSRTKDKIWYIRGNTFKARNRKGIWWEDIITLSAFFNGALTHLSWENPSFSSSCLQTGFCPAQHGQSIPTSVFSQPLMVLWLNLFLGYSCWFPRIAISPEGHCLTPCASPFHHDTVGSRQRSFGRYVPCLIPRQTLLLPWQTRPVCRTALRATTLMKPATVVSPATALAEHAKGGTARSASPAHQAGSSWARSACPSAGKGKLLNPLFPHLIP